MIQCTFTLNNEPMSFIKGPGFQYRAYSGESTHRNKPGYMCTPMLGAIPLGRYAIVDRESGGLRSKVMDALKSARSLSNRFDWLALYALDGKIDDEMFCNGIRRGEFRIHSGGLSGTSYGCVTLPNTIDFYSLRNRIRARKFVIPSTGFQAYGVLNVVK